MPFTRNYETKMVGKRGVLEMIKPLLPYLAIIGAFLYLEFERNKDRKLFERILEQEKTVLDSIISKNEAIRHDLNAINDTLLSHIDRTLLKTAKIESKLKQDEKIIDEEPIYDADIYEFISSAIRGVDSTNQGN